MSTHPTKRHTDEGQGPSDPKRPCSAENLMWIQSCRKNRVVLEFEPRCEEDVYWEDDYPTKVTFHSVTGEHSVYQILNGADDRTDVILRLGKLSDFSWTQTFDWSSLEDLLRRANFRRSASYSTLRKWTSTEEIAMVEGPMRTVWPRLKLAFRSDFMNGDIKQFLLDIFVHAIDQCGVPDLCAVLPFPSSSTNSHVQSDMLPSDDVQSLHSSLLSLPQGNQGIVVPDVIIHHKVERLFVLNVECKRGSDRFNAGVLQCVKQMLSQMHWQDLHFGYILSPLYWQIIVMQKQQLGIEMWQDRFPLFKTDEEDPEFHKFDVDSFYQLFGFGMSRHFLQVRIRG